MDQVTAQALTLYAKISGMNRAEATARRQPATAAYSFGNGNGNGHGNGHNRLAEHQTNAPS
jgi:hypothetical protein